MPDDKDEIMKQRTECIRHTRRTPCDQHANDASFCDSYDNSVNRQLTLSKSTESELEKWRRRSRQDAFADVTDVNTE